MIHWDPAIRRSTMCLENAKECVGCRNEFPQKYRGYVNCWCPHLGTFFLELTLDAANQFQDAFGDFPDYRGCRFVVKRSAKNNGRLNIERLEVARDSGNMPEEQDPEPILRILWDWKRQ
jgi:hypothetical protein